MTCRTPLLRPEQFERYRRHLSLPEFGVEGQRRLMAGSVLLIGAGGLGCPLAQYLAAAGVGRIGLVDFDVVDESNLQRQVLYGTADVGRPKVDVARERIEAMNPDVRVETLRERLSSDNALAVFGDYDVVVDGTDNFPTRYLSNDACVLLGKPNVYGAIFRFDGQASTFDSRRGPCYRCLFPEPPPPGTVPDCAEGGVLGVLPGIVAMIQATETLKWLAGIGEPLIGRLLHVNALEMKFSEYRFAKDPQCPICGAKPRIGELVDYEGFCGLGAADREPLRQVSAAAVKRRVERGESLLLLDVRDPDELEKARIEGARPLPLGQLEARLGELEDWRERPVVVHCHRGGRSEQACRVLLAAGFREVAALSGGIEAWSLTVDPAVPRY
jgi:adenylyltransferase/sulfurtransferase